MSLLDSLKQNARITELLKWSAFTDKKSGKEVAKEEFEKQLIQELEEQKSFREVNEIVEKEEDIYKDFFNFITQKFTMKHTFGLDAYFKSLSELISSKKFKEEEFFDQFVNLAKQPRNRIITYATDCLSHISESLKLKDNGIICNTLAQSDSKEIKHIPAAVINNHIKLYTEVVKKNPRALELISLDVAQYEKLCKEVIHANKNTMVLEYVAEHKRTFDLCKAAVKNSGDSLKFLPASIKADNTKYLILAELAVTTSGMAIRFVDLSINEKTGKPYVSKKQYEGLCKKAVSEDGFALEYILANEMKADVYKELCLIAVKQHAHALQYVPTTLDKQTYKALCEIAIEKDPKTFFYIPDEIKIEYPDLVRKVLEKDISQLEYVPAEMHAQILDDNLCQSASKQPGKIQYIPEAKRSLEMKKNALITNFSDKQYLAGKEVVELAELITQNSQKKTIIVVADDNFQDEEVNLSRQIYASKHQAKNECVIAVEKKDLQHLLDLIAKNNEDPPIKLVVLGHGNKQMETFADFSPADIAACVEKNPAISKVVFLGCNTAAAKATAEEQQDIDAFIKNNEALEKINPEQMVGKNDKKLPTGKNIKTSDPSYLNENSFLAKVYKEVDKLPGRDRDIELKGSTRLLFPDRAQNKFHSATGDIKKDSSSTLEIDESKRAMDVKKRLQDWKENTTDVEKETQGKYFTITRHGK